MCFIHYQRASNWLERLFLFSAHTIAFFLLLNVQQGTKRTNTAHTFNPPAHVNHLDQDHICCEHVDYLLRTLTTTVYKEW